MCFRLFKRIYTCILRRLLQDSWGPEVAKIFMLTQHEIIIPHKYKRIKKFSFFSGSDGTLFFLLINVKMSTVVDILIFMSRKISCSAELSMNFL